MKILKALVVIYSPFVALWFAAYLIAPDRWWPFILLNKLAYFFLVAAIPVFLIALLARNSRAVGLVV